VAWERRTTAEGRGRHPNSPPGVVRLPNKQLIFQTDSAVSAFSSKSQPASRPVLYFPGAEARHVKEGSGGRERAPDELPQVASRWPKI